MDKNIDDSLMGNENNFSEAELPSATATLALGIISIATCWLYGIPGIACGIIAIVLYRKDKVMYDSNPTKYEKSYKNSFGGYVCGIIGLCLSALFLVYLIIILAFFGEIIAANARL